jgi:RNA polymerase sigma-70 factor (ECF subfamily)
MMTTVVRAGGEVAPPGDGDVLLLARVAAGDRVALAALYERHRRPLFAYLVTLLGERALAEEALQDTLLAVWRSAAGFQGRSRVSTWLFGIARRQALSRLRRRRPVLAADDERLAGVADPGPGPEAQAVARLEGERVVAAVARLSPVHREVLVLSFWHGLTQPELVEVLGVPVGTVKSRLSNARKALLRTLTEVA